MNAPRIAEIRERLDKATPGPWEYSDVDSVGGGSLYGNGWMIGSVDWANDLPRHSGSSVLDSDFRTTEVADANGELIAHAPDDLAFLLDLVAPVPSGEVEPEGIDWKRRAEEAEIECRNAQGRERQEREGREFWQDRARRWMEAARPRLAGDDPPLTDSDGDLTLEGEAYLERIKRRVAGEVETPARFMQSRFPKRAGVDTVELAGEVETPGATCGGTREIPALSKQGRRVGVQLCPDCGVETPEAARAKATAAIVSRLSDSVWGFGPDATYDEYPDLDDTADAAIDALLAQGWTPPGTEEAK